MFIAVYEKWFASCITETVGFVDDYNTPEFTDNYLWTRLLDGNDEKIVLSVSGLMIFNLAISIDAICSYKQALKGLYLGAF